MSGMYGCSEYDTNTDCPQGILGIILKVVEGIGNGIIDQLLNFKNILIVIVLGFILSKIGWPWQLALLKILPFDTIKGAIYYIFLASKFSPIGFIFGTEEDAKNPVLVIYEHKFFTAIEMGMKPKKDQGIGGIVLKDLNTRFYTMYIILLLLIFFTIIILITTNTVIDCSTYNGFLLSFFRMYGI